MSIDRTGAIQCVTLWIPGPIANPQSSSRGGTWHKRARLARTIRERVAMAVLAAVGRPPPWPLATPKLVRFVAYVGTRYDDDRLPYALAPYRDGLMDLAIFGHASRAKGSGDHPSRGHLYSYSQVVSRGKNAVRGVEITVGLR